MVLKTHGDNRLLSVMLAVAPKITCFSTRASLWEQNVHLRCEIRSNPRVFALFWIIDSNGTTLAEGEVIDERWIIVVVSLTFSLKTNSYPLQSYTNRI